MSKREQYSKSPLMTKVEEYISSDAFEKAIDEMRKLGWYLRSWEMTPHREYAYIIVAVFAGEKSSK